MKKGKIVLGVAAALVTVAGAFAFKTSHKYGIHKVYGFTTAGRVCLQCFSLWTVALSHHASTCFTAAGGSNPGVVLTLIGKGIGQHTFYTQKVNGVCTGPTTKVTVNQ